MNSNSTDSSGAVAPKASVTYSSRWTPEQREELRRQRAEAEQALAHMAEIRKARRNRQA